MHSSFEFCKTLPVFNVVLSQEKKNLLKNGDKSPIPLWFERQGHKMKIQSPPQKILSEVIKNTVPFMAFYFILSYFFNLLKAASSFTTIEISK